MYVRDKFTPTTEHTRAFLARAVWATIVSVRDDGTPTATHVPVICKQTEDDAEGSGGWIVEGHIARNNPHWRLLQDGAPALCILQGAHCYVSSAWYEHPSAPTWNYQSVHLSGRAYLMDEEADARRHLRELVARMEGDSVADGMEHVVTEVTFAKLLTTMVVFRIEVDQIDSALKMSQNKDDATFSSIVSHLVQRDEAHDPNVASIMRSLRPELFNNGAS